MNDFGVIDDLELVEDDVYGMCRIYVLVVE